MYGCLLLFEESCVSHWKAVHSALHSCLCVQRIVARLLACLPLAVFVEQRGEIIIRCLCCFWCCYSGVSGGSAAFVASPGIH